MAFNTKSNFPTDGSANERNNRLNTLINNTTEIGAGSETLDGIVFNYTNRVDLIGQLRTSLNIYLLDATSDWNPLEDEFSQTAIVNKWESQTGLSTAQLPEKDAVNTFTASNTFSSQVIASAGVDSSGDVDLNNNNLVDTNQLRFNSGIWLRSNNDVLEFSSDSGTNWEVVGVPNVNPANIRFDDASTNSTTYVTAVSYTGSGVLTHASQFVIVSNATVTNGFIRITIDGSNVFEIQASSLESGSNLLSSRIAFSTSLLIEHRSSTTQNSVNTIWNFEID